MMKSGPKDEIIESYEQLMESEKTRTKPIRVIRRLLLYVVTLIAAVL